jgi:hypothetical protein
MPSVRKGSGRWQQARREGRYSPYTTDRISEGRETWAASAIRTLAGTKSMAWINVTAGSPGAHPCRRSDDFVRPHRHRHVLSFRMVCRFAPAPPPWRACTRTAPYSPARRYAVSGTGKCRNLDSAHRAPSAALTAATATAEVESAKPTLLPFAIPRCSSLQYGKMLAAR